MNFLDLFSGIGGFALGLERSGHRVGAFCEIDPYCRRVLQRHWPRVPVYEDIRSVTAARLRADGVSVDAICGGFPCQDISIAGKGAGVAGTRSGLWSEYARLIGELRPRVAIVENVTALLNRGLDVVLRDLAALGYDAEWHCIQASDVGAPHRRDRIWIVALGNADQSRLEGRLRASLQECASQLAAWPGSSHWIGCSWVTEPDVGRVAVGVSSRVDRLRSLGNAVVPQIVETIGWALR